MLEFAFEANCTTVNSGLKQQVFALVAFVKVSLLLCKAILVCQAMVVLGTSIGGCWASSGRPASCLQPLATTSLQWSIS